MRVQWEKLFTSAKNVNNDKEHKIYFIGCEILYTYFNIRFRKIHVGKENVRIKLNKYFWLYSLDHHDVCTG